MKNTNPSASEILDKIEEDMQVIYGEYWRLEPELTQALHSAILSRMPEKKPENPKSMLYGYENNEGYNQALTDIKQLLNDFFGDKNG